MVENLMRLQPMYGLFAHFIRTSADYPYLMPRAMKRPQHFNERQVGGIVDTCSEKFSPVLFLPLSLHEVAPMLDQRQGAIEIEDDDVLHWQLFSWRLGIVRVRVGRHDFLHVFLADAARLVRMRFMPGLTPLRFPFPLRIGRLCPGLVFVIGVHRNHVLCKGNGRWFSEKLRVPPRCGVRGKAGIEENRKRFIKSTGAIYISPHCLFMREVCTRLVWNGVAATKQATGSLRRRIMQLTFLDEWRWPCE
jgi:hypothetical protein